ncbi:polygalacturonate 4-alpha-galacturonosyltransferase [Sarracenia purpurea var. burkii]
MAIKRGLSGTENHRNRGGGSGGSRFLIAILVLFSLLVPLIIFVGRGLYTSTGQNDNSTDSSNEDLDWRKRLALQHVKSLFSKEVIDVIKTNTNDLGPLSLDVFRKNNLSASWKVVGLETAVENNSTSVEQAKVAANIKKQVPRGKQDDSSDDHSQFVDTPAKLARRQLREKRREERTADLLKQDDEVTVKLENAAIERSKSVDSAILGKYSIWRKENDNENSDSTIRLMRDQMIMARVYISIANMKNKHGLAQELQIRLKENQRALGEATADGDLPRR